MLALVVRARLRSGGWLVLVCAEAEELVGLLRMGLSDDGDDDGADADDDGDEVAGPGAVRLVELEVRHGMGLFAAGSEAGGMRDGRGSATQSKTAEL